jgi:urease beta subunit
MSGDVLLEQPNIVYMDRLNILNANDFRLKPTIKSEIEKLKITGRKRIACAT